MDLFSETGMGHLVFEQAAEIRDLKARLERHEEANNLFAYILERVGPIQATAPLAVLFGEVSVYGATGWVSPVLQGVMEEMRES